MVRMGGEILEAYKRIEQRQYLMALCLTISTVVTLFLLVLYGQLSTSNSQSIYRYSSIEANYSAQITASGQTISSLSQSLSGVSASYNQIRYNLSNLFTQGLYSNYAINIPARKVGTPKTNITYSGPLGTFNTTYTTRYYTYNFSFNALYPGYLLFNITSTIANTQANSTWEILVSNGQLIRNSTLYYYNYESGAYSQGVYSPVASSKGTYRISLNTSIPYSLYAPLPSQSGSSVKIPVENGTVRVWIVNFANQSAGMIFSAKYIGTRTG